MHDDEETKLIKRISTTMLYMSTLLSCIWLSCYLSDVFFHTTATDVVGDRLLWIAGTLLVIGWMPPISD